MFAFLSFSGNTSCGKQWLIYHVWLLVTWRRASTRHQRQWYWRCCPEIFNFHHTGRVRKPDFCDMNLGWDGWMAHNCSWSHASDIQKWYLYARARYKQPIGELFLPRIGLLLCQMNDTIRLVPTRFDGWVMAERLGRSTQQWVADLP